LIGKDKMELSPADNLRGLGNYATVDKLKGEFGDKVGFVTIGQAGEWKLAGASIAFTDMELRPTRHAGRGGLGAVMGSKGLKAIIIDPSGGELAPLADKEAFKEAAKRFAKALGEHAVTSQGLPTYGTDVLINIINEAGGLPTRNFSSGRFETADKVGGESLNKITVERKGNPTHGCMAGCVIRCSGIYLDEKGEYVSKWPEYETVWAWGPNCEIDDLDAIARIDHGCDDIGLDTIEMGNSVAVAMEGGVKEFGDAAGAEELLAEIGKGTPLGRILGSGAAVVGKTFGVRRVPVVKNQALPAYGVDPQDPLSRIDSSHVLPRQRLARIGDHPSHDGHLFHCRHLPFGKSLHLFHGGRRVDFKPVQRQRNNILHDGIRVPAYVKADPDP